MSASTVINRYKLTDFLGKGAYARVRAALHIGTNRRYACKIIDKRLMSGREAMVRNEIKVLRKISQGHPNVLNLVACSERRNKLYIITDLAEGGELEARIAKRGTYYEQDAVNIIRTICDAVAYLHDNNVVHRDLKPENILFLTPDEDSDLIIADFGLSRIIDPERLHQLRTYCGTPAFMAPEVSLKQAYEKPVDMWAIGVIAYYFLSGKYPFDKDDEVYSGGEANIQFEEEYWSYISEKAKDFIKCCLDIDVVARIKAREALGHPWLDPSSAFSDDPYDLLPGVRANFDARGAFRRALDMIRITTLLGQMINADDTSDDELDDVIQTED